MESIPYLITLFGLVLVGVFALQVGYIRHLRAEYKRLSSLDPEDPGFRRTLVKALKKDLVAHEDLEDEISKVRRALAELDEFTRRNVNKHIARNARETQKEEEAQLMEAVLNQTPDNQLDLIEDVAPVKPSGRRRMKRKKRRRNT